MSLPAVSCFSKIQIGFTFLVPAHLGSPGKRAVKRARVCVKALGLNLLVHNNSKYSVGQKVDHKLMATILSNLNQIFPWKIPW